MTRVAGNASTRSTPERHCSIVELSGQPSEGEGGSVNRQSDDGQRRDSHAMWPGPELQNIPQHVVKLSPPWTLRVQGTCLERALSTAHGKGNSCIASYSTKQEYVYVGKMSIFLKEFRNKMKRTKR